MARRNARRRPPKKASSSKRRALPAWLWFTAGLGCCLLGVFLYQLTTLPSKTPQASSANAVAAKKPAEEGLKFRFYDTLRQFSVNIDADEKATSSKLSTAPAEEQKAPPAKKTTPVKPQNEQHYFLQAGSFKQREQAEKRRIELLLLNTDANITRIKHGGTPWYRVRTGPYNSYQQVDNIRDKLLDEGIDTMVTRR